MTTIKIDYGEIYIEPISSCNLECKLCYTKVLNGRDTKILSNDQITTFIDRFYNSFKKRFKIYWCGTGEVFLHADFPKIINLFTSKYTEKITHMVMTNGIIDRLDEFNDLSNVSFFVSIDGFEKAHEWNRGKGTFSKSLLFCKKAIAKKCKAVEVRTLITQHNIESLLEWERFIIQELGTSVKLNLISPYRSHEIKGQNSEIMVKKIAYDDCIPERLQIKKIFSEKYPPRFKKFLESERAYFLSICLNYNGIYNCCEAICKIGDVNTPMVKLIENLVKSKTKCISCPLYHIC